MKYLKYIGLLTVVYGISQFLMFYLQWLSVGHWGVPFGKGITFFAGALTFGYIVGLVALSVLYFVSSEKL